jgi:hypothetical protein
MIKPFGCVRTFVGGSSSLIVHCGSGWGTAMPVKAIAGDVAHKKKKAIASLVMGFPFSPLQSL